MKIAIRKVEWRVETRISRNWKVKEKCYLVLSELSEYWVVNLGYLKEYNQEAKNRFWRVVSSLVRKIWRRTKNFGIF